MATIPTYDYSKDLGDDPNVGYESYHVGDESLIQIGDNPMVWLLDKNKNLRAFSSTQAFNNAYANDIEGAIASIVKFPDSARAPGRSLDANVYRIADPKYSIREDGTMPKIEYNPSDISSIYGQNPNEANLIKSSMALDGLFDMIKNVDSGVSPAFLDTILSDKDTMAAYIGAAAYGGYSVPDILMDIKRKELVSQGRKDLEDVSPISLTQPKSRYQNTNEYREASTNPMLTPPAMIGKLNTGLMDLPVFNLPDEVFKTLVPIMDVNSTAFKDAYDKITDAYHDIVAKQLAANTESEKAVADHDWEVFKETTERDLGIKLSGNALDAWKQLEDVKTAFSQRGIQGSGLEAETIDDYLKSVRKTDQIARTATLDANEKYESEYFNKFATPEQIKQLAVTDPEKAKKYGLLPSDEIRNSLSFNALKEKYPDLSDEKINRYISTVLDEHGNYRSGLYNKYALSKIENKDESDLARENQVFVKAAEEERLKMLPYRKGDPFVRTPESRVAGPKLTDTIPVDKGAYPSQGVMDTLAKKDKIQNLTNKNTGGVDYSPLKPGEGVDAYTKRIGVEAPKTGGVIGQPSNAAVNLSKSLASGAPGSAPKQQPTSYPGLRIDIPKQPATNTSTSTPQTKIPAPTINQPTPYKPPSLWGAIKNTTRQMFGL